MRPPEHADAKAAGLALSDLRFSAASATDRACGLLYFAEGTYGLLRIAFTVRVTRAGRQVLSFPIRHDRHGKPHVVVRPVDDAARRALEAQVFSALDLKQETVP